MRNELGIQNTRWSVASLLILFLLASCGGDGGGSDAPQAESLTAPTQSDAQAPVTTVAGNVMKGPVRGALVSFFEVDDYGLPISALETTTPQ